MKLKDLIAPFSVWKRATEKPYTAMKPLSERPGADRYRGFHINDQEKCIGCGSCEAICQNGAIDMVEVAGVETTLTDSGLRPRIDYGRCCWCALCVDICTTDSLAMSNEYVWIDEDPEVFRFIAGAEGKPWDNSEKGYRRSGGYSLLDPERVPMILEDPKKGVTSFIEMVKGYSADAARQEARRCVDCGLCIASCPAHMDIPDYIRAIRDDDLEEAVKILYRTNPMPATCGRICTRNCESACAIGVKGDPVAIRWLKRYIIDAVDPSDITAALGKEFSDSGKTVAVIGAGPGGLSCAYYLARMGHHVTVFESSKKAGGMIRYGVPEYRMPYDRLDDEIAHITEQGVTITYGVTIGVDKSLDELAASFDAVFISTGLPDASSLRLTGEDLPGVLSGVEFLERVARGETITLGRTVAVIGGGNVAIDAARTARRFGAETTIYYRRREEDMPADWEEIHDAKLEGVEIITQSIPIQLEKAARGKTGLVWGRARMEDQGPGKRPRPVLIVGETYTAEVDTVISAIGQTADLSYIAESKTASVGIDGNKVLADYHGRTENVKIFAGGDVVNSIGDAIAAIADGYRAARSIDAYVLTGKGKT
ncbi:FAD-dependent oxidoreductase [bacterium]|nr:FAD-dependent oxidoreductase [bacterium]